MSLNIDITFPCLFTKIFNFHCPGCGLTRAFIEILKLNFIKAWQFNSLIYLVFPSSIFFIISDFIKFKRKNI